MTDQISMFDGLDGTKAGDTTEDPNRVGRCLTWEEACAHIGRLVWYQTIMQSLTYWTAVIPEQRLHKAINFYRHNGEELIVEPSDRLICYNGTRQRLLIDEHFVTGKYQYPEGSAFYTMKEEQ